VSRRFCKITPASSHRRLPRRLTTRRVRPVPRGRIDAWTRVVLLVASKRRQQLDPASRRPHHARQILPPPPPKAHLHESQEGCSAPARRGCRDPDAGDEEDARVAPPRSASTPPSDPGRRRRPPWLRQGGRGHHGPARTSQAIVLRKVNQRKIEKSEMS
jgi:hypothetical protein